MSSAVVGPKGSRRRQDKKRKRGGSGSRTVAGIRLPWQTLPPRSSSGEDGLAVCLAFPHRTKGFLGTFHRQNGTNLRLDSGPGNQVYHHLHVIKRPHDGTGDGELVSDNRKQVHRDLESGGAAGRHQCAATVER